MPVWENYRVEVETKVTVITGGRSISEWTVFGEADGTSNENVKQPTLVEAVISATSRAAVDADRIAAAVRINRRKVLGYKDGD